MKMINIKTLILDFNCVIFKKSSGLYKYDTVENVSKAIELSAGKRTIYRLNNMGMRFSLG